MQNDLIADYRANAIAHGKATLEGESDLANEAHDSLTNLLQQMSANSSDEELLALLDDEEIWVQLWAATHTLEIDEARASSKLQSIADAGVPIASMTARYTLQGWKAGSLSFREK